MFYWIVIFQRPTQTHWADLLWIRRLSEPHLEGLDQLQKGCGRGVVNASFSLFGKTGGLGPVIVNESMIVEIRQNWFKKYMTLHIYIIYIYIYVYYYIQCISSFWDISATKKPNRTAEKDPRIKKTPRRFDTKKGYEPQIVTLIRDSCLYLGL